MGTLDAQINGLLVMAALQMKLLDRAEKKMNYPDGTVRDILRVYYVCRRVRKNIHARYFFADNRGQLQNITESVAAISGLVYRSQDVVADKPNYAVIPVGTWLKGVDPSFIPNRLMRLVEDPISAMGDALRKTGEAKDLFVTMQEIELP